MAGRIAMFGWADSVHVQRWATGLAERGYEIRLISLGGEPVPGVETYCLPRRGRWSYFLQSGQAVKLAREFAPDLVHVHYAGGFGSWGVRCDFAPLLVSVWGTDVVELPHKLFARRVVLNALRRADHIAATNEYLMGVAAKLVPSVQEKTTVIPFGVTLPDEIVPEPADGPIRLCFIKMHRQRYGPDLLLKAFAEALIEHPDMILTMAGEGRMTPSLKRQAAQLQIADRVEFAGLLPHHQILTLLQESHLMVMPSLEEAFGVAALEASACARPVIATQIGGVPEVVRHNETGMLIPPGDQRALAQAIAKLASDPSLRSRLGERGRAYVGEKYIWSECLDRMSRLYARAIKA